MRFWVVSPNVMNDKNMMAWLDAIRKNHCVYMGYGPGEKSKKRGYDFHHAISKNDVILVAHGSNKNKKLYFAGLVDSAAKEVTPQKDGVPEVAYARKLKGMIGEDILAGLKLDFTGSAKGETRNPGAIYELHPKSNPKDRAIADKLKDALEKTAGICEADAQTEECIALLEKCIALLKSGKA